MRKKTPPPPNGNVPDPDDSSEILLADVKRSISDPSMPAVTDEELAAAVETERVETARDKHDTLPPWAPDKIRKQQIQAWNAMAAAMVNVVKTVKKNEERFEATVTHVRMLVVVALVAIVVGSVIDAWQGYMMRATAAAGTAALQTQLDAAAERQTVILEAIVKLTEAQTLWLDANSTFDPEKDAAAKDALLDAQRAALEAKKATTTDPAEKADADRKIEAVDEQVDGGSAP